MSEEIVFEGFKKMDSKKTISINSKALLKRNNYFENTDADKLRIFIDLDGKVKMDEKEFSRLDKSIIKVLKSTEDISIITSSDYKSEKWV